MSTNIFPFCTKTTHDLDNLYYFDLKGVYHLSFGEQLNALRKEKGLTREALAKGLGISYWRLGKYETGERKPDYKTLMTIADYFEVSVDYLLGRQLAQEDSYESIDLSQFSEDEKKEIRAFVAFVRQRDR